MAHWLEVPDLEELLKAKDEMPPSLDLLRECVEAIAAALERDVVHEGEPPIVTFRNHHGAYYNVSVHAEEYRITYIHLARIEFAQRHTEELAWSVEDLRLPLYAGRDARRKGACRTRRVYRIHSAERVFRATAS
jgi:hypothetical protein